MQPEVPAYPASSLLLLSSEHWMDTPWPISLSLSPHGFGQGDPDRQVQEGRGEGSGVITVPARQDLALSVLLNPAVPSVSLLPWPGFPCSCVLPYLLSFPLSIPQ